MRHDSSTLLQIYRALLRSSAPAVRFSGPAKKNTRRYLRDEITQQLQSGIASPDLLKLAQSTIAFHLASSLSPRQVQSPAVEPTQDASVVSGGEKSFTSPCQDRAQLTLPHRIVANLSSLTYHHLSPHTQMQNLTHMRSIKSVRRAKSVSAIARVLGKMDIADDSPSEVDATASSRPKDRNLATILPGSDAVLNAAHLRIDFLQPSRKPPRGPSAARLATWDGQDYTKQESTGALALMQKDLDTIESILSQTSSPDQQSLSSDHIASGVKPPSKKLANLRQEANELKAKIKARFRQRQHMEKKAELDAIPIEMLANLVSAAQNSEKIWLGKQRWLVRQQNGFLPP